MLMAVKNQIKVSFLSIKYALLREMLNKTTFITNIIFMILNNASFIIQWIILYSLKENVGGYTFNQVLLLWGLAAGTYGVSRFFFQKAFSLSDTINNGKLDAYLEPTNQSNIIWKSQNKKRVIYAPHHSFYKDSMLGFGTFDWNYKFFFNFAKNHPEIEFIIKPHPELKRQIVKQGLMSISEMTQYFEMWENLPNAQVYEYGNYFDMFKTSDLLITDCNSFLYEYLPTKKPVIHLISESSVGHNSFGEKIISGYYNASNIDELNKQLELVLFKNEDPLLPVREKIIAEDLIQPKDGVAKFIEKFITDLLQGGNGVK